MTEYLETTVDKFIFRVATDRLYSREGVWAMDAGAPGRVRLGLSDFVQQRSGDAAFVHLKPAGTRLAAGDEFGELETIKATLGLISPAAGEIVEINQDLDLNPENINQDPYRKGWLAVIQAADWEAARARLLEPAAYLAVMRAQAEEEQESP
jgi:glycine cleavage system H protein